MESNRDDDRGRVKANGTRSDRRHPALAPLVVAAVLIVLIVGGLAAVVLVRTLDRLDGAITGGCERLQAERERNNVAEANIYFALKGAASNPGAPEFQRMIYTLGYLTAAYSPPANCEQATRDPENYVAPPAVPYISISRSGDAAERERVAARAVLEILNAARRGEPQPVVSRGR